MAKSFAITTTATETLKADARGRAQAVFTVTNVTARPVRGLTRAKALDATKREWLSITGESERDFGAGATAQFTVRFDAAGVPPGKYPFRLDVDSAQNPEEDFTEGPAITVEVASAPAPPEKTKFPIWIIIVIAALVLLIGGVILFLVLRSDNKPAEEAATPTSTATPVSTERINVASGKLATQSSNYLGGSIGGLATRAVDGNTDGAWPHNSVTHTNNEGSPWWQVDLGAVHSIAEIKIWNRTDCCGERLSNFYVFISSTPFTSTDPNATLSNSAVSSFPAPGQAGSPTTIAIGKPGRFVRIQLMGTDYLSLAEVEILADVPK
jgi:F5/8 type C domain-containing protein